MRVTARLSQPLMDADRHPILLDSLLAWATAQRAGHRQLRPGGTLIDFDLPLARWDDDEHWGWCASAGTITVIKHGVTQLRKKPDTAAMAHWARDKKHHIALGPHKARDTAIPASIVAPVEWEAITTDRDALESLLTDITHLGKEAAHGYGRIAAWTVAPSAAPDGWQRRPLPGAGPAQRIRPPYWWPEGRIPCLP